LTKQKFLIFLKIPCVTLEISNSGK
jgi:hypothetical protein